MSVAGRRSRAGKAIGVGLPVILLVWSCLTLSAQASEPRPRVGLVLGGGGARGGAHVGALMALQDLNIPVDYVAGTSMGAVVGSLYAVGMTPAEIENLFRTMAWNDLFNDHLARPERTFRRKENASGSFLPFEWGWRGGLVMPNGLIAGQKFSFVFRDKNLYLGGYRGFDNLAYPFRAVATDLQTGEMFAPDRGNLLKMVRASLSIPGVFPPVRWGDRILVDGYLVRNLPVDVCRQMGAEIIIAVDVAPRPGDVDPDTFHDLLGVALQKDIIFGRQNMGPSLELADFVIRPELEMMTLDFEETDEAIRPGYEAVMALADTLRALALAPPAYAEHVAQHTLQDPGPLRVSGIRLVNRTRASDRGILANIHQQVGRPLDLGRLKQDLLTIYDFGIFSRVDFSLEYAGPDEAVLLIHTAEKYYAPHILNFGATYYGATGNASLLEARLRWTWLELNDRGAELRTDLQAGPTLRLRTEFYQPLNWSRGPFLALSGQYANAIQPWYHDLRHRGDYKTQTMALRPELGLRIAKWGELRAGLDYGYLHASDRTELPLDEYSGARGGWVAALQFDKLDLAGLPLGGYAGYLKYSGDRATFGGDRDFDQLEARLIGAGTWGRNTFNVSLEGGSALNSALPEHRMFTLGGLDRLTGYSREQLRGQEYLLGQLKWHHKIHGGASPFSSSWYLTTRLEAGNAWYQAEGAALRDLRTTGSVGVAVTTLLGPLTMAYGRSTDGNDAAYVTLGYWSPPLARGKE